MDPPNVPIMFTMKRHNWHLMLNIYKHTTFYNMYRSYLFIRSILNIMCDSCSKLCVVAFLLRAREVGGGGGCNSVFCMVQTCHWNSPHFSCYPYINRSRFHLKYPFIALYSAPSCAKSDHLTFISPGYPVAF